MVLEDYSLRTLEGVSACLDELYLTDDEKVIPLTKLLDKYQNVVFDTSALITSDINSLKREFSIAGARKQDFFLCYLNKLMSDTSIGGELLFTPRVLEEYLFPFNSETIPTPFQSILRATFTHLDDFVRNVNCGRLLNLNKSEEIVDMYLFNFLRNSSIGFVDKDVISKGCTISKSRGKTAIVSNDRGLMLAWKDLIKLPFLSLDNVHHYARESWDGYAKTLVG